MNDAAQDYWRARQATALRRAEAELRNPALRILRSEDVGVFWTAYRPGRSFRVVRQGAYLTHGSFGESAGRIEVPVGSVITVRGWHNNHDSNVFLIWQLIDGEDVDAIMPDWPHPFPFAVFRPHCSIRYGQHDYAGKQGLPLHEMADAPDPTYIQPVAADGEPADW